MLDFLAVIIATATANNVILNQAIGADAALSQSQSAKHALSLGLLTGVAIVVSGLAVFFVDQYVLTDTGFVGLRLFVIVLITAAITLPLDAYWPSHASTNTVARGPLVLANTTVLGTVLLSMRDPASVTDTVALLVGHALGFLAVLLIVASIRQRVTRARVPTALRGGPLLLIVIGLLALAASGLDGMTSSS
ncbi:MAG: Rnf-Nqr domain containing protein [Pseudomonadota bacterium]